MLARSMAQLGHDVSVVGVYSDVIKTEIYWDAQVQVVRLPHSRSRFLKFWANARNIAATIQQLAAGDYAYILEGFEASFAFLATSVNSVNVIRMHGGHHFFAHSLGRPFHRWKAWQEKRSFDRADYICAVSQFVAETTRQLVPAANQAIEILPNFIDTALFKPKSATKPENGLIVFAGTITPKKGVAELVQAMPAIIQACPDAKLLLIGRDTVDSATGSSYIAQLKQQIPTNIKEHIQFQGPVEHSELPNFFAQAQVCAFPSHMESQGIVVIEAMAMGKMVVASRTGPGPELVEHGISGYLCDPHDPADIAQYIIAAFRNPEALAMGQHARQAVEERFSTEGLTQKNAQFYMRCLKEQQNKRKQNQKIMIADSGK